jgi:hypothetical protein
MPLPKHPPILRACFSSSPNSSEKLANTDWAQLNLYSNNSKDLLTLFIKKTSKIK